MTWADAFFGGLLALFCIGGLLIRRSMFGLNRKPGGDARPHAGPHRPGVMPTDPPR